MTQILACLHMWQTKTDSPDPSAWLWPGSALELSGEWTNRWIISIYLSLHLYATLPFKELNTSFFFLEVQISMCKKCVHLTSIRLILKYDMTTTKKLFRQNETQLYDQWGDICDLSLLSLTVINSTQDSCMKDHNLICPINVRLTSLQNYCRARVRANEPLEHLEEGRLFFGSK